MAEHVCAMYLLYAYERVRDFFRWLCSLDEPYSVWSYINVKKDLYEVTPCGPSDDWWDADDNDFSEVYRHTRFSGGHSKVRTAVLWKSDRDRVVDFERPVCAPWVSIGYIRQGVNDQEYIDCTYEISEYLVYGNRITPDLLRFLYPESEPLNRWTYIDAQTFESRNFHRNGIVIGISDDPTNGYDGDAEDAKKND